MSAKPQVSGGAAGELACRPGSLTPGFLTCRDSHGTSPGLRRHYGSLRGNTGRFGT